MANVMERWVQGGRKCEFFIIKWIMVSGHNGV
jgi:hypothetical protein